MNPAVRPFLKKMRMILERMFSTVFQNKIRVRMKQVPGENFIRNPLQAFQGVWRISEYDVELLVTDVQKIEHIVPYHNYIIQPKPVCLCLYERSVFSQHLDTVHPSYSPGPEFKRNGSGPSKEIQNLKFIEFIFVIQDIKQGFSGKSVVGRAL